MDDLRIVELYFARNEEAIRQTDIKYGRLCRRVAYNILGDDGDAAECVNDTYMGIWNAIPPARPENFRAFLCRIVRNLSLKRLELQARQKRSPKSLVSIDDLAEVLSDDGIAEGVGNEEIGEAINAFLKAQKSDVRKMFVRKYYFFDSIGDIAREFGFSESKVKNILYHTRIKLKKYLIEKGIAL